MEPNKREEKPEPDAQKDKADNTKGIKTVVQRFVSKLEGIKTSEEIVMPLISAYSEDVDKKFNSFIQDSRITSQNKDDGSVSFSIPITLYGKFEKLRKRQSAINSAERQTPCALFVALVSTYDAFLGELLREIFYIRPELLNASNKTFTFPELVKLDSISAAREHLIDKEVESVLRESHEKHFAWMENRFDLVLRKGLDSWVDFIELTERRNLFVHADGVVSAQYLAVCESQKVPLKGIKVGTRLHITPEYFEQAFECLLQIGVKLSQVLTRKFCPSDLDQADSLLNDICFELLKAEKFRLAANLLEFSLSLKKYHSALNRRLFVVNLGIAYKIGKLGPDHKELLEKEDWSDCAPHFKLARAVLMDRFKEAESIMLSLGKKATGISRLGYETWPLFKEFRNSSEFRSAFEKIYGEKFNIPASDIDGAEVPAKKVPAKKVPAKKVPAKKVPAKKVPAKKVPAK